MKRAMVTTGGTGGHIFPALAVARALRAAHPGLEVRFVGGQGPEGDMARAAGLPFDALPVRGVLGRGWRAVGAALRLGVGLVKAVGLVRSFKPQVVAGFGGYAGFCPVLAASLCGIPTAVHEQNSVPGAANRMLARVANRVLTTYPDASGAFPKDKVLVTGNPIRPEIAAVDKTALSRVVPCRVLVLGGSQGARAVNRVVARAWPRLAAEGANLWHQTGKADLQATRDAYQGQKNVRVEAFIDDMAEAYAWADLVIARAGATTLAEVAAVGLPSVLIPFPFATADHQSVNASYLARAGAAVVMQEKDIDPDLLARTVLAIFGDESRLAAMGRAARSLARPDAAQVIARELERLAR